jgi:hypothetical protein
VLLGELAILGGFVVVPEVNWYRRMVREENRRDRLNRYGGMLFVKKRKLILPHWRIPFAYIGSVVRAEVNILTRLALMQSALSSFGVYWRQLVADIFALFHLFPKNK